ncbi:hypothetical protein ABIC99_002575 [Sphaerotilus sulfidivorans]|uniref:Uncharacterized protein n=1 Tax=Sphaerotilus sulfidivorans TaxID=639200 RepID=A0ABV2IPI8_9BURK
MARGGTPCRFTCYTVFMLGSGSSVTGALRKER